MIHDVSSMDMGKVEELKAGAKEADRLNDANYDLFLKAPEFYRGTDSKELGAIEKSCFQYLWGWTFRKTKQDVWLLRRENDVGTSEW